MLISKLITHKNKGSESALGGSKSLLFLSQLATSVPENPDLDFFCSFYSPLAVCEKYQSDFLKGRNRPIYNFRAASATETCDLMESQIFRSGQMAPENPTSEEANHFRERQLGFKSSKIQSEFSIDEVINLRFDTQELSFQESFGVDFPSVPLSSGEKIFSLNLEKRMIEEMKIKLLNVPSPPESEHFVGRYVPRLDRRENSRAHVCRLPKNLPDGASKHWLEDHLYYR